MKLVEVIADQGSSETIAALAAKYGAVDFRILSPNAAGLDADRDQKMPTQADFRFLRPSEAQQAAMRLIVDDAQVQAVTDALQTILGAQPYARILVVAVETALPRTEEEIRKRERKATAARDALYDSVAKDARLDANFVLLAVLSTVVASIGLIENDVAVVIGAMVIAPLLGPNLALGLGAALGDGHLIRRALITTAVGIGLACLLGLAIGFLWPFDISGPELLGRTVAGFDSIALALASGTAAALSLTNGLSSVLVGVMVAVALLPPAATIGLTLSQGRLDLATGAALLLAINLVCVNLATKLVLLVKGVRPRTFSEKIRARRTSFAYLMVWVVSLVVLVGAIYWRGALMAGR